MPKETFINLPKEKRKLIEEVATDEFAEYGFEKASINRIVEKCKIAKGSFYQYFEDKKDLLMHIMAIAGQKKVEHLSPILADPTQHDFFTTMRALYSSGLKFASHHPKLAYIGMQFLKYKDSTMLSDLKEQGFKQASGIYEQLLISGIERGEIRGDIDVKYISYMLLSMSISNMEYWVENIVKDLDEVPNMETMMDTVNLLLDFIKNGIGATHKGGSDND